MPSSSAPNWQLIAKVFGAILLTVVASVTGYVVLVALGEPADRRDADNEIREILAKHAEIDVQQAGTDARLALLLEGLRKDLDGLEKVVEEMHPHANGAAPPR